MGKMNSVNHETPKEASELEATLAGYGLNPLVKAETEEFVPVRTKDMSYE